MDVLPGISSIAVNTSSGSRTIWSGQKKLGKIPYSKIDDVLKHSDFCLSDCNFKELSDYTVGRAKDMNIPIVLDAGSWKEGFENLLSRASYTIASSMCKVPTDEDFMKVAYECGCEYVAVTYGGEKIEYRDSKRTEIIRP